MRPVIGLTTYREEAAWGVWHLRADVLQAEYADTVVAAGGVPLLLPPATDEPEAAAAVVARLDGLVVGAVGSHRLLGRLGWCRSAVPDLGAEAAGHVRQFHPVEPAPVVVVERTHPGEHVLALHLVEGGRQRADPAAVVGVRC